MTDIPERLIELELAAEVERARLAGLCGEEYEDQRGRYCAGCEVLRVAIAEYAAATGQDVRVVERAVRQAARQAQEDPAVE
ncbi:hypothetical protein ACFV6E_26280 [Streptomyces sp. NPDC059785]|uniref:hypothetical protein n=1 Tax=unclassified Streptomyces TaxID=2593676 RepID=UPI0036527386